MNSNKTIVATSPENRIVIAQARANYYSHIDLALDADEILSFDDVTSFRDPQKALEFYRYCVSIRGINAKLQ